MEFGIDISRWQGNFDFNKAKAEGVKFVIIKAGGADGGLYTDSMFATNYANAKKAGLKVGCYYYADAYSVSQGTKQISHYLSIIRGKQFDYPVAIDIENKMLQQSKATLDSIMRNMLNQLEQAGYWAAWYAGLECYYWHCDGPSMASRYTWWLPYWGSSCANLPNIQMWQFGGEINYIRSNKIAGVVCDQDYSYKDFSSLIKSKGLNGYTKAQQKPQTKTLHEGAKIKLKSTATIYGTKRKFADFVYKNTYVVQKITGANKDRVAFGPTQYGANTGAVDKAYITLV